VELPVLASITNETSWLFAMTSIIVGGKKGPQLPTQSSTFAVLIYQQNYKKCSMHRLTSARIDVSSEDEDDRGLGDVDADAESAVSAGLCKADEASPNNVAARTIESFEACFKD